MHTRFSNYVSLPNLLSFSRLFLAPLLIVCIHGEFKAVFILIFAIGMITDVLDGYAARKLGLVTNFGSKLDSFSDFVLWSVAISGIWLMWSDTLEEQKIFVWLGISAAIAPPAVSYVKYSAVASYHQYSMKIAALAMGPGVLMLLLDDIAWLFQVSIVLQLIASVEDIAITLTLKERHFDVPSFLDARELVKKQSRVASTTPISKTKEHNHDKNTGS